MAIRRMLSSSNPEALGEFLLSAVSLGFLERKFSYGFSRMG